MNDKKDLVTYCGLYCPACGIRQGKIAQAVEDLQKVIRAYGLDKEMGGLSKAESAFAHYDKFSSVLEALGRFFGSCDGCRKGGGPPDCKIRNCASDRGYSLCTDCADMDKCEILKSSSWALPALEKIRSMGLEKWVKSMDLKVRAGWSYLDEKK
jgi:hypothetical protein